MRVRGELNKVLESSGGGKLSVNDFVIKVGWASPL